MNVYSGSVSYYSINNTSGGVCKVILKITVKTCTMSYKSSLSKALSLQATFVVLCSQLMAGIRVVQPANACLVTGRVLFVLGTCCQTASFYIVNEFNECCYQVW